MKIKPKVAAKHVGHLVQQNSPTILSAVAVVGVAATGYLTFKATWKASRIIDDLQSDRAVQADVPMMTVSEQALKIWKLYIPAVGVGATTIFCVVASNRIAMRRLAALAAAYGLLSGDFDEYRNKALELLGDKKAKTIDDKMAEEKILKNPPPAGILLEEGKSWFQDQSTGRYVKTDRQAVERACNDMNYKLQHGGEFYVYLNDFYRFLGMDITTTGDLLGWTNEQKLDVKFTPVMMPGDQAAATGFRIVPEPSTDFDSVG